MTYCHCFSQSLIVHVFSGWFYIQLEGPSSETGHLFILFLDYSFYHYYLYCNVMWGSSFAYPGQETTRHRIAFSYVFCYKLFNKLSIVVTFCECSWYAVHNIESIGFIRFVENIHCVSNIDV